MALFSIPNRNFPSGVEKFSWVVHIFPRAVEQKDCTTCNGMRTVGGGFHDLDGPQPCPTCNGTGSASKLGGVLAPPELEAAIQKLLDEHLAKDKS